MTHSHSWTVELKRPITDKVYFVPLHAGIIIKVLCYSQAASKEFIFIFSYNF